MNARKANTALAIFCVTVVGIGAALLVARLGSKNAEPHDIKNEPRFDEYRDLIEE